MVGISSETVITMDTMYFLFVLVFNCNNTKPADAKVRSKAKKVKGLLKLSLFE